MSSSEELEGHNFKVQTETECAVCWSAEFALAGEAEVGWVLWQVPSQNITLTFDAHILFFLII